MTTKNNNDSFLHEFQLEGKANAKIPLGDWETALNELTKIRSNEASAALKANDHEDWPTSRMSTYCHDCRAVVPPEVKTFGRRTRSICGICGSKKISSGREDALKSFYHLDDETMAKNLEAAQARPKKEWKQKPRPFKKKSRSYRGAKNRSNNRPSGPKAE